MKEKILAFGLANPYLSSNLHLSKLSDHIPLTNDLNEILDSIRYFKKIDIDKFQANYSEQFNANDLLDKKLSSTELRQLIKSEFESFTLCIIQLRNKNLLTLQNGEDKENNKPSQSEMSEYVHSNTRVTPEEYIEEFLIQIRQELYPKPLIIINLDDINNHKTSHEFEIALQDICTHLNIPYIGEEAIQIKTNNLYKKSDLPNGSLSPSIRDKALVSCIHDEIAKINDEDKKKSKYQVYYVDAERVKNHFFYGFGDYIRGSIYLHQLSIIHGFNLRIHFGHHLLSNFFYCRYDLTIEENHRVNYTCITSINNEISESLILENDLVFTNGFPLHPLDSQTREYIKINCLTPRIAFQHKITAIKNRLGLVDSKYIVIHVRLEDDEKQVVIWLPKIRKLIRKIIAEHKDQMEILLVSSNQEVLEQIQYPNLLKTNLSRGHTGLETTSSKQMEETMLEFMLMTTSKKIFQLSVFWWGSGFSDTAQKIYQIPVEKINLNKIDLFFISRKFFILLNKIVALLKDQS